jgi:hypothetical protein
VDEPQLYETDRSSSMTAILALVLLALPGSEGAPLYVTMT